MFASIMFASIHAPGIAASGIAQEFSPQVEILDPSTVLLDAAGLARLFGSPQQIAIAIARKAGPHASVAIAATRAAALYASRGYRGVSVIPPGEEAGRLGSLPVRLLDAGPDVLETFARWGIRSFRDLAALPELGLIDRFGQEGHRLWRIARGDGEAPFRPEAPPAEFSESLGLDDPVALLEPLAFVLSRLLNQVCAQLADRGLSALALHLVLTLENGEEHESWLRLPMPMRNAAVFLKWFQLDLESRPPRAAVTHLRVTAQQAIPRPVQEGLFVPPTPEPEKLELTLKRIAAIVGGDNVGSPRLVDSHRPGAFQMAEPFPKTRDRGAPGAVQAVLAIRLYRPPAAARVSPHAGPPGEVFSNNIRGRVVSRAGPWRTSGDWWSQAPWARDDWDIALSDGALYRLFRDAFSGHWFVDGQYD